VAEHFASRQASGRQPVRNPLPAITVSSNAPSAGATTILNPAPALPFDRELLDLVDILILNESELGLLARTELRDTDDHARFIEAAQCCRPARTRSSASRSAGHGGICAAWWRTLIIPGRNVKAIDTPAPATALSAPSGAARK